MDYNTRLPPRKRLLAEMKKQSCVASPDELTVEPLRFNSLDLHTRVQEILEFDHASAEEFVEASEAVALLAEKAATEARAVAMEKAQAAVKATAFARSVLEAVTNGCGGNRPAAGRGRKMGIAVGAAVRGRSNGRLHRFANSLGRRKAIEKRGGFAKMKVVDDEHVNGRTLDEDPTGNAENDGGDGGSLGKPRASRARKNASSPRGVLPEAGKKGKSKRKKMLLSQFCGKISDDPKVAQGSPRRWISDDAEANNTNAGSPSNLIGDRSHGVSEESDSLWKRKKLKLSELCPEGNTPVLKSG